MSETCIFPLCKQKAVRDEFCLSHAKYFAGEKVKAEPKSIPKQSKKRKVDVEDKKTGDAWFNARHIEMTGRCLVCNGKTTKRTDIFKNSVAHLFAKAIFKSIKWHEENWIELCFFGNSCHTNFDHCMLTFEDLKLTQAWPEIVRKFKILYPLMNSAEQGRVPEILKKELEP